MARISSRAKGITKPRAQVASESDVMAVGISSEMQATAVSSELQVKNAKQRPKHDSVECTLDVAGDRWSFLILREAFFGARKFREFKDATGIAANILSDRLAKLVEHGVFRRELYGNHRNRYEYRLTEKGLDLYPIIVFMIRWGDKWMSGDAGPPLYLVHSVCGTRLNPIPRCDCCGEEIHARDMRWETD